MLLLPGDAKSLPEDFACYLSMVSERDKEWDRRKVQSLAVSKLYLNTQFVDYSEQIRNCSPVLVFNQIADDAGEVTLKLKQSLFCRKRHCPICQWRKSMMWRARIFKALPKIVQDYPNARFLLLTLTVKNVPVAELRKEINFINKGWQRLTKRKDFPAIGYIKSIEVTREKKKGKFTSNAHPHIHAILMVNSSYFSGQSYISQNKWIDTWQSCLRIDYKPSVRVNAVKSLVGDKSQEGIRKALLETLKYAVKPEDLIGSLTDLDRQWLEDLTKQLHNTKAINVGGVLKEYFSEEEPENLIHDDEETVSTDETLDTLTFGWRESVRKYLLDN